MNAMFDYRTVATPEAPITAFPNRTLADYQDDLVARFGFLPSWDRLARLENRAMVERIGRSNVQAPQADSRKAAMDNANCAAVLRVLEKPMTRAEVIAVTEMKVGTAKSALHRLINAGLIRRHSVTKQHVTRWERAE